MAEDEVKRVIIIGGGMAGMTAAWELAKLPGYEIHVFEQSWRLGGKGASGRDEDGRIQEHGLHVWLGFYENAFRMMRECYMQVEKREWGPKSEKGSRLPHGSFDEAFMPAPHIGVQGSLGRASTDSTIWSGDIPPAKGLPGDPMDAESNPFTLASYLVRCLELVKTLMLSVVSTAKQPTPGDPRPDDRSPIDDSIELDFAFDPTRSPQALLERVVRLGRGGTLTGAAALLQLVTILESWLHSLNFAPGVPDTWLKLLEAMAAQTRKLLRDLVSVDEGLRWKTEVIDIVITIAVGLYRDRVLFKDTGFDAINQFDYREWLRSHGATRSSLDSPFIRGFYDLLFAYEDGDKARPSLAAGVALRGALRMFFTYRGAMFWRMRSGMGDAVFAPLYKVLLQSGRDPKDQRSKVQFHFLHELRGVDMGQDEKGRLYVARVRFVALGDRNGLDKKSLKALDHFGCWPANRKAFGPRPVQPMPQSDFDLHVGSGFDYAIFAIGVDDLAKTLDCADQVKAFVHGMPEYWRTMFDNARTVATQAAQVWHGRELGELGWHRGPAIVSGMRSSFETWADMTQTLPSEQAWRDARARDRDRDRDQDQDQGEASVPGADRSVSYLCGVLPESHVAEGEAFVAKELETWLDNDSSRLWPDALKAIDPPRPHITRKYVRSNGKGSERYTQSLPKTIACRISPLDMSVLNMSIAGDWTACGLDAGCVEAAVMSGLLAVHAITGGTPKLSQIVGFDHP